MANILIRGLDDGVVTRLKAEAAANDRSLQAEIRQILTASSLRSLAATRRLSGKWLAELTASAPATGRTGARKGDGHE